jgi:predicted DCC family thiol-disulfide oxidoreductase YuxK
MSANPAPAPQGELAYDPKTDPVTWVVYDGECPFCSQYVKLLRLREQLGKVKPVSARDDHAVVRYVKSKGIDLNQEMALVMKGEIYSGADCIHRLALMSTGSGFFNGLMSRMFASRGLTRFMYPIMRTGRNATLALMGRKAIS